MPIKCKFCGKTSESQRSTKQFCDAACRSKYFQIGKKMELLEVEARGAIRELKSLTERYPEFNGLSLMKAIATNAAQQWQETHNKHLQLAKQEDLPMR